MELKTLDILGYKNQKVPNTFVIQSKSTGHLGVILHGYRHSADRAELFPGSNHACPGVTVRWWGGLGRIKTFGENMEDILRQIEATNEAGYYYVALFSALTLPDICAALESTNGETNGERYANWYDRNVDSGPATGKDIYRFRCSLLHQGRMTHPKSNFSRIIFIEPEATANVFHNCIVGDALLIDVQLFISDLLAATRKWLASAQNTETFQKNSAAFVTRHPEGLKPYVTGLPIIG